MRFIFAIFLWLVFAGIARAQTGTEAFCGGKYVETTKIIQRFDGISPYSGGNFFSSYNQELKPTIDSYRAMTGLLPLGPKAAPKDYDYKYDRSGWGALSQKANASTYKRAYNALKVMTQRNPDMHKGELWDAIIDLDLLTSRGPADDWWLRSDDFKILEGQRLRARKYARREEFSTHMTRAQKHIANIASRNEAIDWLQTALILSAELYPWRYNGQMPSEEIENLLRHIETRALETEDVNSWYALLAHHRFYGRALPALIQARASAAVSQISSCQADPKTFAIITSGDFGLSKNGERGKNFLESEAKLLTVQAEASGRGLDFAYHYEIQALADASANKKPFALPLMLSSPSINEVMASHRLSQTVTRPLIMLPARDLAEISPATAFTHYLSFDQTAEASVLINHWLEEDPANRAPFEDILQSGIDEKTLQTLITLRMPCLSPFLSEFCVAPNARTHVHRNIGSHRGGGDFIRRELAEWLYPSFEAYNYHQRYYRQYDTGSYWAERRGYERWRDRPGLNPRYNGRKPVMERGPVPEVFSSESFPVTQGLAALAQPGKLKALSGDKNLVRVLSLNVFDWVELANDSERMQHSSLMAEGLYRIIRENRHESGGAIDGIPLQQKAYQLLHRHFEETEWAKKTPYWWTSHASHG
jgi:hypothetical protein